MQGKLTPSDAKNYKKLLAALQKCRIMHPTEISVLFVKANRFLGKDAVRKEKAQIKREVQEKISILEEKIAKNKSNMIGVHVRMNTDITKDVPGIQNIDTHSPASAKHMGPVISERARCNYKAFIPHMERVLEKMPQASFFIASDSSCAILSLISKFPGKVLSTDLHKLAVCEGSTSRGKNCLQMSLSEFWVLGSSVSYLILSEWSSASELILRLGAYKVPHETGCLPRKRSFFGFLG